MKYYLNLFIISFIISLTALVYFFGQSKAHASVLLYVPHEKCITATPTPIKSEPTETQPEVTETPVPTEITPTVEEVSPTLSVAPTEAPSSTQGNGGSGVSDGRSDGRSSCPSCTQAPKVIIPLGPPSTGRG